VSRRKISKGSLPPGALRTVLEVVALPVLASVLANTFNPTDLNSRFLAALVFFLVAGIVLIGRLRHYPTTRNRAVSQVELDELHAALAQLRRDVVRQWSEELSARGLEQPKPIELQFVRSARNTAAAIEDPAPVGPNSMDYLNLGSATGRQRLVRQFLRLDKRQLLILGERGSGKSTTALLLTTDLLLDSTEDALVPVLLSLADWNPADLPISDWICDRVASDYPEVANINVAGDAVRSLMASRKIVAVLDGLDERSGESLRDAILSLNESLAHGLPAIITCRTNRFIEGTKLAAHTLADLPAFKIRPIAADDVVEYLSSKGEVSPGWDPLIQRIRSSPHSAVGQALSTPLMLWLAARVFTRRPGMDNSDDIGQPSDLLDEQYSSAGEIEAFLLGRFLKVVYSAAPRPADALPLRRYSADKATRYLTFLAKHLTEAHWDRNSNSTPGTDINWWRLYQTFERWEVAFAGLLIIGPIIGIPALALWVVDPHVRNDPIPVLVPIAICLLVGIVVSVLFRAPVPGRFRLGFGPIGERWSALKLGISYGCIAAATLTVGLVSYLAFRENFGKALLRAGTTGGLAGLAVVFVAILNGPVDTATAPSPQRVLREDRRVAMAMFLFTTVLVGLVIAFENDIPIGLAAGTCAGIATGIGLSAWGWFVVCRTWLYLTGRAPVRYMDFLEDAYLRGVLRKSGTSYQFRHARLRNILVGLESEE
jgi:hypothetical protein